MAQPVVAVPHGVVLRLDLMAALAVRRLPLTEQAQGAAPSPLNVTPGAGVRRRGRTAKAVTALK